MYVSVVGDAVIEVAGRNHISSWTCLELSCSASSSRFRFMHGEVCGRDILELWLCGSQSEQPLLVASARLDDALANKTR